MAWDKPLQVYANLGCLWRGEGAQAREARLSPGSPKSDWDGLGMGSSKPFGILVDGWGEGW